MKAMIIKDFGGTDVFEARELAKPELVAGHLLIKVAASSVNTVDTMIRSLGEALPFAPKLPAVLGMDFAGTVESVGEGVTAFKPGDKVYGCAGGLADLQGALAEYILADAQLVAHKPASLSMREAAALPLVGITAYEGLTRSSVSAGQKVLVHGGAGGVGHVAAQLAKHMGATVFATIGRDEHVALMEALGVTPIPYRNESVTEYVERYTGGSGFDVVFDSVSGANLANSFEAAALNGHVAATVSMLELDLTLAHLKGLSLHVVFMLIPMLHNIGRTRHGEILATLAKIADAGGLKPIVDEQEFALDGIAQAHERLTSGKATGKIVISVVSE